MRIYLAESPDGFFDRILLFGLGMIGRAVAASLAFLGYREEFELPFHRNDTQRRQRDGHRVLTHCLERGQGGGRVTVAWSAGATHFGASEAQMQAEHENFLAVLDLAVRLTEALPEALHGFFHVSSAGGLFEGQRMVDRSSQPRPLRPYGVCKLQQEALLEERFGATHSLSIFRPNLVYGPPGTEPAQKGMIDVLTRNAAQGRESAPEDRVKVLRDYVYARDVFRFLAAKIAQRP